MIVAGVVYLVGLTSIVGAFVGSQKQVDGSRTIKGRWAVAPMFMLIVSGVVLAVGAL